MSAKHLLPQTAAGSAADPTETQTVDVAMVADGGIHETTLRLAPPLQDLPGEVQAILARAHATERQTQQTLRAHQEAKARFDRANEAWQRVATFKGDRIPRELTGPALTRAYAELIVGLGSVLKADGWQARVDAVTAGPEAKTYALAVLQQAMAGDVDKVATMIDQELARAHVGEVPEERRDRRASVPPGAPDLLIVRFERSRDVEVHDRFDIGSIDTHSKGIGGADDA